MARKQRKREYLVSIAVVPVEDGEKQPIALHMVGRMARGRAEGRFRSPEQFIDACKIAQATGAGLELTLEVVNMENMLAPTEPREPWQG